jgi:hypothetical protein
MFVTGPVMAPGCIGMLLATVLHLATLLPQALAADTHTGGAPVYGFGKLTWMELVLAPDVIVHPTGTVQL